MLANWIGLIIFVSYYVIYQIIWATTKFGQIKTALLQGNKSKIRFYLDTISSSCVPAFIVLLLPLFTELSYKDIGIGSLAIHNSKWFSYPVIILIGLYSLYLIYQTIALRICAMKNQKVKLKLQDEVASLLPKTNNEKWMYVLLSLSAALTEEILFRGYLMHIIGALFPQLHLVFVLLISAAIFGIAHLYQGKAGILSTGLIGLAYGTAYLAFGSIIPLIAVHFIQDVSAVDFLTVRDTEQE